MPSTATRRKGKEKKKAVKNWLRSRWEFLLDRCSQIYNFNFLGPRLGLARLEGKVVRTSAVSCLSVNDILPT
jgi:hypothetical protein